MASASIMPYGSQLNIVQALINGELNTNEFFALLPKILNPVLQGQLDGWLYEEHESGSGCIDDAILRDFVARYPFLGKHGTSVYGMKCLSSV